MTSRRGFLLAGSLSLGAAAGTSVITAPAANAAAPPTTPVFHDSYAGKAGRLARSNSGHTYRYTGGVDLCARDGALRLQTDSTSRPLPAAAYQQADLGAPVTFIGAWFTLDSAGGTRTTAGSGVLLGAFDGPLLDVTTCSAAVHLGIGRDYWAYFVLDHGNPVVLGNGPMAPLATDTVHYAEVVVDDTSATVTLPDGTRHTVSDPRIGTLGRSWLTTEVVLTAATDIQGTYTALQAATD